MKPIDTSVARQSASRKGFISKPGGDHEYLYFHHDGKKTTLRIKISRGARELKQREIRADAMACQMTAADMFKVLNCDHDLAWLIRHYLTTTSTRQR